MASDASGKQCQATKRSHSYETTRGQPISKQEEVSEMVFGSNSGAGKEILTQISIELYLRSHFLKRWAVPGHIFFISVFSIFNCTIGR